MPHKQDWNPFVKESGVPFEIYSELRRKLKDAYISRFKSSLADENTEDIEDMVQDISLLIWDLSSCVSDFVKRMEEKVASILSKPVKIVKKVEVPETAKKPEVVQSFATASAAIAKFQENMIAACSKSLEKSIQKFSSEVKNESETAKISALFENSAKIFLNVHRAMFEESEHFRNEMKLTGSENTSGDDVSFNKTDIEGEQSHDDSLPGGALVSNWAPFRKRVSTLNRIKPFSQMDEEARNLLQRKLQLILHAHKCIREKRNSCAVKHCGTYRDVIIHWLSCNQIGTCQRTHCTSTREIIAHWRNCTRNDCLICQPARLSRKQQVL